MGSAIYLDAFVNVNCYMKTRFWVPVNNLLANVLDLLERQRQVDKKNLIFFNPVERR